MGARPFTLDAYRALLDAAERGGYSLRGFLDGAPAAGDLLLRHDVDMSLSAALAMAELEAERGVRATYFLMTQSSFYNLHGKPGQRALDRLRELGHEVGYHAVWPNAAADPHFGFLPVLAWHTPEPHYMAEPVPGWTNVMDPMFTGDFAMTYRSDSNQHWRRGDPVEDLAAARFPWLQLLIHPVLWMGGTTGMAPTIDAFLDRDREQRLEHLREDNLDL